MGRLHRRTGSQSDRLQAGPPSLEIGAPPMVLPQNIQGVLLRCPLRKYPKRIVLTLRAVQEVRLLQHNAEKRDARIVQGLQRRTEPVEI